MINDGIELISWIFFVHTKNKLPMFGAHCPFISLHPISEIIQYNQETMMFHLPKPMQLKFLFFLTLSILVLLSACNTDTNTLKTLPQINLLPGETAIRTKEFCFYIGSDAIAKSQTILAIPEELYPQLIADPVWSMPQGVSLKTANITLKPCAIEWTDGDTQYSTTGTKLLVEYEVSSENSAAAGKGDIFVTFINLNTLKGDNTFYIDTSTTPKANPEFDKWKLNNVVIFKDASEKEAAINKSNGIGVLVLIGIAAVIIVVIWVVKKL
jgi:hypothetical protein